jgi:hypothetical protein
MQQDMSQTCHLKNGGWKKTGYPDESRPEAPSLPENQRSQAMLPQDIEKIPTNPQTIYRYHFSIREAKYGGQAARAGR